jgi:hypothetical protein
VTETDLMQSIKTKWGAAIAAACQTSSVPEAFVAALIANETGGNNDDKRFEPNVLLHLWEVLLGRKAAYGSIGRADVVQYVAGLSAPPVSAPQSLPADAFQRADGLATSWGLTQIMGYHVLEPSIGHMIVSTASIPGAMESLRDPNLHLIMALRMLSQFAKEFSLDVTKDFEELFRCWNTGQPDGKTFDPNYALNGMTRMAVWTSLP